MATKAVAGIGTLIMRADGLGRTYDQVNALTETTGGFRKISEVRSMSGPTMSKDTIDVTSMDSEGGYREYITGFKDAGEVTLTMNFTNEAWNQMLTDYNSGTINWYRATFANIEKTTIAFEASVSGIPIDAPADDAITFEATLRISGPVLPKSAPIIAVTNVELNITQVQLVIGASTQLLASIYPSAASNTGVTFASSDTDIVTVVQGTGSAQHTAVISAVAVGTANVTVTALDTTNGTITAVCVVTVVAA
jgi:predicted secreted protein